MSGRATALKAAVAVGALLAVVWASALPGQGSLQIAADAASAAKWDDANAALVPPSPAVRSAVNLRDDGVLHELRGDHSGAIASWRAAHLLRPRDPDLIHDLTLVRGKLEKGVPDPVAPPRAWMEVLSPIEVGLAALGAWIVASVLAWRAHRGTTDARVAVAAALIATGIAAPAVDGLWLLQSTTVGVVRREVSVREVPDLHAAEHHTLPEGAEVRVLSTSGDFLLIEDGRGRRGWAVAASLALPPP